MPRGQDWLFFVFINLGFVLLVFNMFYTNQVSKIKQEWPKYRCNPLFMPLSDDIKTDFTYCIQSMQSNYMGYLLQPITYITSNLTNMGSGFSESLNKVREMFSYIRTMITSVFENIFSVFLNLIIEFQKITIGIKDLMGKIIGVVVTLLYVMDGSMKTMQSAWAGPNGQMVRAIGHCFHSNTRLKLKSGSFKKMRDISLGDILEDNSVVVATMKIANTFNEPLYEISNNVGRFNKILVTGLHYVLYKEEFIHVKNHPDAIKIDSSKNVKNFRCLITDTHRIKIGPYIFHDWEDYLISQKYFI
jgi:hypothetical protein